MSKTNETFAENFFAFGFSVTKDETVLNLFNDVKDFGEIVNVELIPDSYDFTFEYSDIQKTFFKNVTEYLQKTYLDPWFKTELISINIWEGVDNTTTTWHYDGVYEGQDFCFLYYFDDMIDEGTLYFKSDIIQESVIPSPGTLVWMNLSDKYRHKADRPKKQRRMMKIDFKIL